MAEETAPPKKISPLSRVARWGALGALILVALFLTGLWALDTRPGHRFLIDRIEALAPKSGLRITIGGIDGSIYNHTRITGLKIYDAQGLLFSSPLVALDWTPIAWVNNRLDIENLIIPQAILHKKPKFIPSGTKRPILPGFDIRIAELRVGQIQIEPALSGQRRFGNISGNADIREGRARITLDMGVKEGGDRLSLLLDAEPDRDKFDIETRLNAPAGGVFGALLNTVRPIDLWISGDGTWSGWKGKALLNMSAMRIVDLNLDAQNGTYALDGMIAPSSVTKGKLSRLASPQIAVKAKAVLTNRRLNTDVTLRTQALNVKANGIIDLGRNAFDDVRISADLLNPAALFPNMTGRNIQLRTVFDGEFGTAKFEYLLTAPRVAFDQTGFEDVRATGKGHLSPAPIILPVKLTAKRVTGVGTVAGGILANLSVDGLLKITSKTVVGDGLQMRSDKLTSKISVFLDLVTGQYDVGLTGQMNRYFIPGLGIIDVRSELNVVPGVGGRGTRVLGKAQVWVRRFDNGFLRTLSGGLPMITTGLERGPDGILYLRNLKLTGPAITMTGNGLRRRDGTFHFEGTGKQAQYGPVKLILDGQIDRPKLDIFLSRPADALGLNDVRLQLDPDATGFSYAANGGSLLGPFTSNGMILLPKGEDATITVANLQVSGTSAKGELRSLPGGFNGQLNISGGGLSGQLLFAPVGSVQQITTNLTANGVKFAGPPEIGIGRGKGQATILLDPMGTTVDATMDAAGVRYGAMTLSRIKGSAKLRGGVGQIAGSVSGSRGRAFDLSGTAQIAAHKITMAGGGTIDRKAVKLTSPAILSREAGGWRLAPTSAEFGGGTAKLAGLFGNGAQEIDASVSVLPLGVLDMIWPELALGGVATGTVRYRDTGNAQPSGQMNLKIQRLSRSGLVLSSSPVDMGIAATLNGSNAAARAVIASGGKIIGRAQAQLRPLPNGGTMMSRLRQAPLFAQIRYNGAADTLWRLTGVEIFDLSGPVAIGADVKGSWANPVIRGSLRSDNVRLESAILGTVLTSAKVSGRFDGSRLIMDSISANAGKGGTITGRGQFDLAAKTGFGIDLAIQADNALLIDRDDMGATVTGPIAIKSDGRGGVISGNVILNRSRYVMGKASAVQSIPRLNVVELNQRGEEIVRPIAATPWRLDIKANAKGQMMVTGLGLDSQWRGDLDLGGTVEAPEVLGTVNLVRGGYEFAGRRFDLERGVIRFQGESPPDPTIDIVAAASMQGLNATIRVSGSGLKPDISFASVPALPEDELLSRLLFGTSITTLSAPEALQLAAALAALRSGDTGLNPINAVRRAAGLDRLRIIPADKTTGQLTSIAVGKYVTRRTYVELVTDGQGYSATNVEFQITRWLSLLGSISTLGRESVNLRASKDY